MSGFPTGTLFEKCSSAGMLYFRCYSSKVDHLQIGTEVNDRLARQHLAEHHVARHAVRV